MEPVKNEQRRHSRYDTEVKIYFEVPYDIKTKVKYKIVDGKKNVLHRKHQATSKNVSAQGLCFTSQAQLHAGDILDLDVYPPGSRKPVLMQGEVRWSQPSPSALSTEKKFDTGVQLKTINGESVEKTIHFDAEHQMVWSAVLDAVFSKFKALAQKMHKSKA